MSDKITKFDELRKIDTPTISNVVATYPDDPLCLNLYDPWESNWYTDNSLRCWYPHLGPVAGYAVTCVFGLPDADHPLLDLMEVLEAIDASPKPVIVCFEQRFPPKLANKVGLSGGHMTSSMKCVGAVGVVTNGPSRDIDDIRRMGFQYLARGVVPGHGPQVVRALQCPVSIAGLDVVPGDIIHMDGNGAVKFPAEMLDEVLTNAKRFLEKEQPDIQRFLDAKEQGVAKLRSIEKNGSPYMTPN